MLSRQASETLELRQKRLVKERQVRFRKRQKIDHERIMDERQKKLARD